MIRLPSPTHGRTLPRPLRAVLVLMFLYLFLVGVSSLEAGIKGLGAEFQAGLLESVNNPVAGLCAGILATVLVQSSSVSTATIVGLVGAGTLNVDAAVPMIMGANIGTTITNTLASLASITRSDEFRRAFAAATQHDLFNIIAVLIFLPLQISTGFLSTAASWLADLLGGNVGGGKTRSPIKEIVREPVERIQGLLDAPIESDRVLGAVLLVIGLSLIFFSLAFITVNMRRLFAEQLERSLNSAVARGSGLVGMAIGTVTTIAVQSSSITTSILIPLVASGVLALRNAFPITLGANVGTTVTALLASLAVDLRAGLVVALTHTLFNLAGIGLIYPFRPLREVPVRLAEKVSRIAAVHPLLVALYVIGIFIIGPVVGIVLLR
ncbi:MAG: Na/Pi symporter [Chloroflexi bacterium]|nr:Na/Pi symporter [Chloroflexota bacterium]